jgi:TonB family protein
MMLLLQACATPAPEKSSRALPILEDERYMLQVREQIKKVWAYPCIEVTETDCEYKAAELDVEISVLQSGQLQYVKVIRSSGFDIYDSYAVNAIRLAAPYPPVPAALIAKMTLEPGTRQTAGLRSSPPMPGLKIAARFTYYVQGREVE